MTVQPFAPLVCQAKGKLLHMATRPHALETSIIGMLVDVYRSIISKDFGGPND